MGRSWEILGRYWEVDYRDVFTEHNERINVINCCHPTLPIVRKDKVPQIHLLEYGDYQPIVLQSSVHHYGAMANMEGPGIKFFQKKNPFPIDKTEFR